MMWISKSTLNLKITLISHFMLRIPTIFYSMLLFKDYSQTQSISNSTFFDMAWKLLAAIFCKITLLFNYWMYDICHYFSQHVHGIRYGGSNKPNVHTTYFNIIWGCFINMIRLLFTNLSWFNAMEQTIGIWY